MVNRRTVSLPKGCDLCGHDQAIVVYPVTRSSADVARAFTPTADDWGIFRDILKCERCGLWFSLLPSESELASTYNQAENGHERYISQEAGRTKTVERTLDFISSRLTPRDKKPTLIDIGTWSGLLVGRAKARGWQALGVEANAAAAEAGRKAYGIEIIHGNIMDVSVPGGPFDVVTLAESIEHFYSPRAALSKIHGYLAPGGLLYLSTPNAKSLISKISGRRWPGFRMMHFFFFDSTTIRTLLEKTGFKVLRMRPLRKNFSIEYILSTALRRPLHAPLGSMTMPIWAGDMELIAERI